MSRSSFIIKLLCVLVAVQAAVAFAPHKVVSTTTTKTTPPPVHVMEATTKPIGEKFTQMVCTTAAIVATSPLVALAEEVDDYEYGAVDAPIGIAVVGGILAILTALLPIALQGGEEAFEEMKARDSNKWGKLDK